MELNHEIHETHENQRNNPFLRPWLCVNGKCVMKEPSLARRATLLLWFLLSCVSCISRFSLLNCPGVDPLWQREPSAF